jgi:hypothetical protein
MGPIQQISPVRRWSASILHAHSYPQGNETALAARFMLLPMALAAQQIIELIVFSSEYMVQPKLRQFDGPVSLALALMITGSAEKVPGFNTISDHGVVRSCTAYCDTNAKHDGKRINSTATGLWHVALKRDGLERGLRREDGSIADWLAGDVVVVLSPPFMARSAAPPRAPGRAIVNDRTL